MAIRVKQNLSPADRILHSVEASFEEKLETAHSFVEDAISTFFTKHTTETIVNSLVNTGVNELTNDLEGKLTDLFNEYLAQYDRKLTSLIRAVNHIIPFPSMTDLIYGLDGMNEDLCKNPYLELDPYITGTFFVFIYFPEFLVEKSKINISNLCGFLAKSYDLPQIQIETTQKTGFGRSQISVPSVRNYDRTLTITFYDTYNLAVQKIFETWINGIIDMRSGMHNYSNLSDIKGVITILSYTPSMNQVVDAKTFLGVYPTSIPLVSQTRDNINIREVQVTFAYDTI